MHPRDICTMSPHRTPVQTLKPSAIPITSYTPKIPIKNLEMKITPRPRTQFLHSVHDTTSAVPTLLNSQGSRKPTNRSPLVHTPAPRRVADSHITGRQFLAHCASLRNVRHPMNRRSARRPVLGAQGGVSSNRSVW
jgi:hypothetical protein